MPEKVEKLLIIDDEPYAEKMQAVFSRRGIRALWKETGLDGVSAYSEFEPDAVLLDFHLPDITGIEVFKMLKEHDPDVRVYFISASPSPEVQQEAKKLGGQGFFMKPVNLLSVINILIPTEK